MTRTIHNMRRFLTRTGTLVALLAVVVVLGFSVGRVFVRQASFYREIAALEAERDRLSSDNRSFERKLVFVSSEAFLEQEARESFSQKRPGETAIYIDEALSTLPQSVSDSEQRKLPLQLWIDFLFSARL
ncbi:MAG: hypothetical protein AAB570_04105 [Patescibacteria group bacterium]